MDKKEWEETSLEEILAKPLPPVSNEDRLNYEASLIAKCRYCKRRQCICNE